MAARAEAEKRAEELTATLAKYQADNEKYQQGNIYFAVLIYIQYTTQAYMENQPT